MPTEENRRSRTVEPKAPSWLRAGMRTLDAVLPPLAARLGERLFLTPPRHQAPPREHEALANAASFHIPFRGRRLRAWRWGGGGEPVLLVHGWGGRGGQLAAFAPALVEAGLPVVAFDGPAHGRSDGRLASAPDFAEAIRAVAAHLGGIRGIVAHSMGALSTVVALRKGLRAEAVVFVGPSLGPRGFLRIFGETVGLSKATQTAVARRLEERFGVDFESYDVRDDCATMTIPLLVVHDRRDTDVGSEQGEAIAGAWPGAELLLTDGLGHRRILRDAEVVRRVAGFLAASLSLPGAGEAGLGRGNGPCATPGCSRLACPSWEPVGQLCASCALAADLFDRSARQALVL